MKIERKKNTTRNVMAGVFLRLYQMIGPFVLRTVMIYMLGMEYVGLNSLFTSILHMLNLAELGVGSALVYSMYKPIAEDDSEKICSLMKLYRLYHRVIGIVVLTAGLIILPFIPYLISGDVPPDINVYILYLMNLSVTVFSYWLFAYKNSLLTAHQRNDVIDKITIVTLTIQYVVQALVLIFFKNYYLYVAAALLSQILLNVVTAFIVNKMYPEYHPSKEIDKSLMKQINRRVRDIFTSKIGEVIVNSADTIVISSFLGLTILGIYNNYYYLITAVMAFVTLIFKSTTAGIGNSLITETMDKNYNDLRKFTFLISWIACVCSCCFLTLYQPFMELWVGKDNMLSFGCVICLTSFFYIRVINQVLIVYKDASGMWHEDRFRPLCTAGANLVMNLIMVQFWGIYGVLLSTVISTLVVGMPWVIRNLFTVIFKRSPKSFIFLLFKYLMAASAICAIDYLICMFIPGTLIIQLILRLAISLVLSNGLYLIIFRKSNEYRQILILFDRILGSKIQIIHKIIQKRLDEKK